MEELTEDAQLLIAHLSDTYEKYFMEPKDHALVATFLDPVAWTLGEPFIKHYDEGRKEEAWELVKTEHNRLYPGVQHVEANENQQSQKQSQQSSGRSSFFNTLMAKEAKNQEHDSTASQVPSELKKWKASQRVDWKTEIARQGKKLPEFKCAKEESEKLKVPLFVAKHVRNRPRVELDFTNIERACLCTVYC